MKNSCRQCPASLLRFTFYVLLSSSSAFAQLGFLFQPVGQSASVGADALFLGTAYGAESITYQWRKNGVILIGQNSDALYLSNLQLSDAGDYDVVASTSSGSITSEVATLSIDGTFTKILNDPLVREVDNSAGSAWGDYDNDGDLDVLVTHAGGTFNSLFRNNGSGAFTKVDLSPITTDLGPSIVATWADYDNDGWLDLLVINNGQTSINFLYHNNADGTFSRVNTGPGADGGNASAAAWADYDQDGWLDLVTSPMGGMFFPGGALYRNQSGTLTRVTANLAGLFGAQSVIWTDYDGDGDSDMFFATAGSFGPFGGNSDVLYRNDGAGVFTRVTEGNIVNSPADSFTTSSADYDGDGDLDLYVGNGEGQVKFLFRNNDDGTFTQMAGELAEEEGNVEGAVWGDYDNDGWLDLFVTTSSGHGNVLYRNNGAGIFSKVEIGSVTGDRATSFGASWVDIDNDGDLDLFVTNLGQYNFLYRNNISTNGWLKVKCIGRASNRDAIGAKVRILATINGTARWQLRELGVRDSFGSPATIGAEFGLGNATTVTTVRIEWPSGIVTETHDVAANQTLTVIEPPSLIVLGGQTFESDAGTRDLNFTVILQEPSTNTVSVDYATADGTAIAGTHYAATNGTIQFPPGVTNLTVPVAVIGNLIDDTNQSSRTFSLVLSNSVGMDIGVRRATGTIFDDDPLVLSVDNASTVEGNVGTTSLVFNVYLNKPWTAPVSLGFSLVQGPAIGGATAGVDFVSTNGSLIFLPGETNQPIPVIILNDELDEFNETFTLNLSNVIGSTTARLQATGTINDDDPLPVVSFNSPTVLEGNAGTVQLVFVATIPRPSGRTLTFNFFTTNGTAVAPADYRSQNSQGVIIAGNLERNISVVVNADTLVEGPEVMHIGLSNALNCALAASLVSGTILDDDFRITSPIVSSSDVRFTFYGISNRQHRIERTFSLVAPIEWTPVSGAHSVTGNGGPIEIIDPTPPVHDNRFYRVLLLP